MTDRNLNTEPRTDEQLIAYLDGEMAPADVRRLEACLAHDAGLQKRLHALDGTWKLLDQLETDAAGHDFTRTTLEMVAAADESQRRLGTILCRRARPAALVVAALLAAGTAGFLAVAAVRPDPNQQLLEDLPVLESLEQYQAIDSLEFLNALREAKLFEKDAASPQPHTDEAESASSRELARKRVEAMAPTEKQQLRLRQKQFAALDLSEQARLRRLHDAVTAAPDAEALQTVAAGYYQWLKALSPFARAELLGLSPVERVEKIANLLESQAADRIKRLGPDEARALGSWLSGLTDRIFGTLPEAARERIQRESDPQRRRAALLMMFQSPRSSEEMGRTIDRILQESDLAELRAQLPEPTRGELERRSPPEQRHIVKAWIAQFVRPRWPGRGPHELGPDDGQPGLGEFFENELEDADLDRLLTLPAEDMQRELRRLYLQHHQKGPFPGFRRPGPPGHGPRPGGHHSLDGEPRLPKRSYHGRP